ncbi:MAG: AzlD domain-containing protein [Lentisphaeria bacterium]|nr:AzlD domain-containing protein [Lentisphaeria bacterium]
MADHPYLCIAVMSIVTFLIRVLPLTLLRQPITNRFIRSFLYYVPYATLAVMTFPAILEVTQSPLAGLAALLIGTIAAWLRAGLFPVAIICTLCVFILEFWV